MESVIRRLWINTLEAQMSVYVLERASLSNRIDVATPEEQQQLAQRFDQITKDASDLQCEIDQLKEQQGRTLATQQAEGRS